MLWSSEPSLREPHSVPDKEWDTRQVADGALALEANNRIPLKVGKTCGTGQFTQAVASESDIRNCLARSPGS
ncbi:MAG: hypothetical protein KDB22_02505 [Planctomycetales bacterium]|nr:hypothetical protein [Planctomycetales bacterium]